MLSRITAVLASTLLYVLVLVVPAQAAFPGQNGELAYSDCGPADCGIFLAEADGSAARQVTHNPFTYTFLGHTFRQYDGSQAWSADGRKLVYVRAGSDELRVINADGSGDTGLGVTGGSPTWAPDGARLAVIRFTAAGYPQVVVMSADGTGATQITNGPAATDPEWSPDGTRIAFTDHVGGYGRTEIATMNPDGSGKTRLTFALDEGGWAFDPSWSPDGTRI